MSMVTIRTEPDEHLRIVAAADASGKSMQKWGLRTLLDASPEINRDQPTAAGNVRFYPFEKPPLDRQPHASMPERAAYARQFQQGGQWYFHDEKDNVLTTWPDDRMQHFFSAASETSHKIEP